MQYIYATRNAFISEAMRFVAQTFVGATDSTVMRCPPSSLLPNSAPTTGLFHFRRQQIHPLLMTCSRMGHKGDKIVVCKLMLRANLAGVAIASKPALALADRTTLSLCLKLSQC